MTPPPDRPAATPSRERVETLIANLRTVPGGVFSRGHSHDDHLPVGAWCAEAAAALASLADDADRLDFYAYARSNGIELLMRALPGQADAGVVWDVWRYGTLESSGHADFRAAIDAARSPIGETPEDPT